MSVMVRHAAGEGTDHVAIKAWLEVGWEFERGQRRHRPGWGRNRLESAWRFRSYVLGVEGPGSRLVACWYHVATVGWLASVGVCWRVARFQVRVL